MLPLRYRAQTNVGHCRNSRIATKSVDRLDHFRDRFALDFIRHAAQYFTRREKMQYSQNGNSTYLTLLGK